MTIDDIRSICMALPGVTEDVKWGADLCFCVGTKMFCVTGLESNPVNVSFKVTDELFPEVSVRKGFRPADYVARYKWVTVDDTRILSRKELKFFVTQSYDLIREKLPAKIRHALPARDPDDKTNR